MSKLLVFALAFILTSVPTAIAANPVALYDWQGHPLSTTCVGSVCSLNISGTINTSPAGSNAQLLSTQAVTTSEVNLSAPANAIAVLVESESTNTANVKWGFSGAATNILSGAGILMEPGRDSSVLPMGTGTYLHLISTSGTQNVDVQWFLSN